MSLIFLKEKGDLDLFVQSLVNLNETYNNLLQHNEQIKNENICNSF